MFQCWYILFLELCICLVVESMTFGSHRNLSRSTIWLVVPLAIYLEQISKHDLTQS